MRMPRAGSNLANGLYDGQRGPYPVPTRRVTSAGAPKAVEAGGDHGAARAEFLHEMRGAVANRVPARIIARIDVIRIIARMDKDPRRRPGSAALRGELGGGARPRHL